MLPVDSHGNENSKPMPSQTRFQDDDSSTSSSEMMPQGAQKRNTTAANLDPLPGQDMMNSELTPIKRNKTDFEWLYVTGSPCHSAKQVQSGRELSHMKKKYKLMKCLYCCDYNSSTPWAHLKPRKSETENLVDHERSSHHQKAVESRNRILGLPSSNVKGNGAQKGKVPLAGALPMNAAGTTHLPSHRLIEAQNIWTHGGHGLPLHPSMFAALPSDQYKWMDGLAYPAPGQPPQQQQQPQQPQNMNPMAPSISHLRPMSSDYPMQMMLASVLASQNMPGANSGNGGYRMMPVYADYQHMSALPQQQQQQQQQSGDPNQLLNKTGQSMAHLGGQPMMMAYPPLPQLSPQQPQPQQNGGSNGSSRGALGGTNNFTLPMNAHHSGLFYDPQNLAPHALNILGSQAMGMAGTGMMTRPPSDPSLHARANQQSQHQQPQQHQQQQQQHILAKKRPVKSSPDPEQLAAQAVAYQMQQQQEEIVSGTDFVRPKGRYSPPWLQIQGKFCYSDRQIGSNKDLSKTKKKYRLTMCSYCHEFLPNTPWAMMKARKFETAVFVEHERSLNHKKAEELKFGTANVNGGDLMEHHLGAEHMEHLHSLDGLDAQQQQQLVHQQIQRQLQRQAQRQADEDEEDGENDTSDSGSDEEAEEREEHTHRQQQQQQPQPSAPSQPLPARGRQDGLGLLADAHFHHAALETHEDDEAGHRL